MERGARKVPDTGEPEAGIRPLPAFLQFFQQDTPHKPQTGAQPETESQIYRPGGSYEISIEAVRRGNPGDFDSGRNCGSGRDAFAQRGQKIGFGLFRSGDSGVYRQLGSLLPDGGRISGGERHNEQLAQYNACFLGDTTKKVIYLTFDCGYENGYTETILDALKKHQAPAAFFVVGNMIETAPDIIRRMAEEGHIVGNHTYHHPDMSKISSQAAFKKELDDLAALYKETTGQEMPRYYRPPQGKYNEENLRQAQALGYRTVFWSLAYVDWYVDNQPSAEQAYSKLLPRIHDGAVVLLHSTSKTNAEILDELLTKWEEMGYTFASLDQLPA